MAGSESAPPLLPAGLRAYAEEVRDGIFGWIESIGRASFDPYDIKGTPLVMGTFMRGPLGRAFRTAIYGASFVAPNFVRSSLGLKPFQTAGGNAHLAQAYLAAARMADAEACLKWLRENPSLGDHPGIGWGLPFGWHSVKDVPPNLPIGHTTMTVGNAFHRHHLVTGSPESLEVARQSARFLLEGLNQTEFPTGSMCLSYTPLDQSQCVNSNIDAAALVGRVGHVKEAERILRFVTEAQNADGSWFYMADDRQKGGSIIDGYHTGMILSALVDLAGQGLAVPCLELGIRYYFEHLVLEDGRTPFAADRESPLDAYSVGQALLTLQDIARCAHVGEELRRQARSRIPAVINKSLRPLEAPGGGLWYRKYPAGALRLKSVRWANALNAWALSRLLSEAA